ncbi:DHA2 family efflux MFS transporter permease subunit [Microlunatus sp. Gsoil 973]|uniref:DHA2 family efflux MFS transporter permease subunit n=1 Tax=Microlunatus sp. Gsoil 973 TaxID=2672569 RepID=UPI0012B484AB|nr:DHA2 family efflux MFS transporter permease subunit [Microlunatus sp. Gsoil 973]QGN33347.1 DHA2 family efflux MFS transporter permease subunit [Microlunatus sp. Gsoil 973]
MAQETTTLSSSAQQTRSSWPALWALVIGFFMILVDATIVAVGVPAIMRGLDADVNSVIWVTSSYLLAYAVPLLITGRLGDRVGPKWIYLIGLTVFTLSSLWCGFAGTITLLIVARVFQGLGASMMTPQTMTVITRTFPPEQRGRAMALWGAVAGIAGIVGPIAGGLLIDGPGWEWIFFINVPVGAVAFVLALRLVPRLETHSHRFDILGVLLSAGGMFAIVFGIQQGESYNWDTWIWGLIGSGVALMIAFVVWQRLNRSEPLVPLALFRDRNFSLSNGAILTVGFMILAMQLPFMLYAQTVRGFTPTQAALLMLPNAIVGIILAPIVGRLVDRYHPRYLAGFGLLVDAVALVWASLVLRPDTPVWQLLLPLTLLGVGTAFTFGPIGVSANRNLPLHQAGAGSGVFNATRQVGSVLGSAAIAALMESRLAAELPAMPGGASPSESEFGTLPPQLQDGFATAMSQSLLLPAAVIFLGFIVTIFLVAPKHLVAGRAGGSH